MKDDDADGWGVDAPTDADPPKRPAAAHRVDAPDAPDDDWGVEPTDAERQAAPLAPGAQRTHPLEPAAARTTPAPRATPNRLAAYALGAIVLLIGGRIALNALTAQDPTPARQPPPLTDLAPPDATPARDAALPPVSDALPDGERHDARVPLVELAIRPVPADVIRARDRVTICRATHRCALAIDLDYDVIAPGHQPYRIDGDALYDRRRSGRMNIALTPEP